MTFRRDFFLLVAILICICIYVYIYLYSLNIYLFIFLYLYDIFLYFYIFVSLDRFYLIESLSSFWSQISINLNTNIISNHWLQKCKCNFEYPDLPTAVICVHHPECAQCCASDKMRSVWKCESNNKHLTKPDFVHTVTNNGSYSFQQTVDFINHVQCNQIYTFK